MSPLLLAAPGSGHATAALAPLLHPQRQRSAPAVGIDAAEIRPLVAAVVVFLLLSAIGNKIRRSVLIAQSNAHYTYSDV